MVGTDPKVNLSVQGKELTIYYDTELQENIDQKCYFCGQSAYGVVVFVNASSVLTENTVEVKKGTPLFNHAQSILRKKMYHGLKVCSKNACLKKSEACV